MRVTLNFNGKLYTRKVHRLVATSFIKRPFFKKEVNHKNGDKLNNKDYNLEWLTHKENIRHATINGLMKRKYSIDTILIICKLLEEGYRSVDIIKYLKLDPKNKRANEGLLYDIKARKTWVNISKDYNW